MGYLMGFVLFVFGVPAIMWLFSGSFAFSVKRTAVFAAMAVIGLGLSVWSIVHMRNVGKGNPMDAFNHEVAPRTSELMADGPYAICRNPMLLGILMYYLGVVVLLWSVLRTRIRCLRADHVRSGVLRGEAFGKGLW